MEATDPDRLQQWMDFTSSLIGSLVWPIVGLVVFLYLRREVKGLVPLVESLKIGIFQLAFREGLNRAQSSVAVQAKTSALPATGGMEPSVRAPSAIPADIDPKTIVLESWLNVERALEAAVERLGFEARPFGSMSYLYQIDMLPQEYREGLRALSTLRNQVAHEADSSLTRDLALQYVDIARRAVEALDGITPSSSEQSEFSAAKMKQPQD